MTEPSLGSRRLAGEPQLSERDGQILRELARESPVLAGLFQFLLRAISEVERPGGVHMLGHAGRELSLGVIRALARDKTALTDDTVADDEKNRAIIARALRLNPDHPTVRIWFKAHNKLVACAHLPAPGSNPVPSSVDGVAAANALIALLWSGIGPFFQARADVERLLTLESPTEADVEILRRALTRPAVRWDFFRRLEHPGWVAPLLSAGLFKHPPDLPQPDKNGRLQWTGWAEGDYLRRMASKVPVDVKNAIAALPETNKNPVVWETAASAALEMPVDVAATLSPKFRRALKELLPWIAQEAILKLAVKLADGGCDEAFALARDALRVVEGKPSALAALGGERKESELYGIDEYEAEQVIPGLADAFSKLDANKALKFLIHRLDDAMKIEWGSQAQEPQWDPSRFWCPDLSQAEGGNGFKEHIAIAIARLAAREARRSPERAQQVLKLLTKYDWRVFRRISLHTLANAGANAPETLNGIISDLSLVKEEYPPVEYVLVLQAQFSNAAAKARAAVADAIIHGPGSTEELREQLTDEDGVPSEEAIRQYVIRWQRKRLRRFGAQIPEELRELASRLDGDESVPQPTGLELELEDTGHSGGAGWSGGPASPLSQEELCGMTADALAEYAGSYHPDPVRQRFDSPTPAGLAKAIEARVREEPNFGIELGERLRATDAAPTYFRGAFEGIAAAASDGKEIEWAKLLPLLAWVAERDSAADRDGVGGSDYADPSWTWAQREALKVISLGVNADAVPATAADALWSVIESILRSDAPWTERQDKPETMDGALMAALNTLAGDCAKAVIEVALWDYRISKKSQGAIAFRVDRFRGSVETLLSKCGNAADAALVRMGQYLPQLLLLDREWVHGKAAVMFKAGFSPPLTNPVWGGYITSQRLYDNVFRDLEPWYRDAAQAVPAANAAELLGEQPDATWSTTRHLVEHVLIALLRGLIAMDAEMVALTFSRSPISDRSHGYWGIFRSWTDHADSIPRAAVERLLDFWKWRLDVLERGDAVERKAEAGALGWLFLAKPVPDDRLPALLAKTAELAGGSFPMEHSMWERLVVQVSLNAESTMEVADRIIRAELLGDYPHFNVSDVGVVLNAAIKSGSAVARQRARDVINLLGDHGFTEFGELL